MTQEEYIKEERLKFYLKDEQIYQFYFGDIELGKKYHSPLRESDPNPSLVFMVYGEKLYWKDFGHISANPSHDSIGFVQELVSFQEGSNITRAEAVDIIFTQLVEEARAPKRVKRLKEKVLNFYDVEYRDINKDEMSFWNKLHIYERDLNKFNVKAVAGLFNNCSFIRSSMQDDPMFVYLTSNRDTFKVYRPYAKEKINKFKGINNGGILEGWEALPAFGDMCLINSSLKDTIVCTKAGYPGCNSTSETSFKTLLTKVRELNSRFKKVVVFFDNDNTGITAANRLKKEIGWDYIYLPESWSKDPSDLVKQDGNYFNLIRFLDYNTKKRG